MDMAFRLNRLKTDTAADQHLVRVIEKTGEIGRTAPKRIPVADSMTRKTSPNETGNFLIETFRITSYVGTVRPDHMFFDKYMVSLRRSYT